MATFEFSNNFNPSGFTMGLIGAKTNNTTSSSFATTPYASALMPAFSGSSGSGLSYFHIMTGTMPTDPETLTSFSERSANVLITWQRSGSSGGAAGMINGTTANQFSGSNEAANPMQLISSFQAASGTGSATWFWWNTRASNSTTATSTDVVYHSIIGSVGVIGSGSDLEISNTSITSGKLYKISNFRILLPTLVTY